MLSINVGFWSCWCNPITRSVHVNHGLTKREKIHMPIAMLLLALVNALEDSCSVLFFSRNEYNAPLSSIISLINIYDSEKVWHVFLLFAENSNE